VEIRSKWSSTGLYSRPYLVPIYINNLEAAEAEPVPLESPLPGLCYCENRVTCKCRFWHADCEKVPVCEVPRKQRAEFLVGLGLGCTFWLRV